MPWIKVPKLSGSHPLVMSNAVQVRLIWSLLGRTCSNVLGGSVGGGYANSQAHADALGVDVLGDFTSSGLAALMPASSILVAVGIRDLRTANQVEYISTATEVVGTGSGDALPNELAAVVTLRTALAGKHYRGRVYISGANEAQNLSAGTIATAFNTGIVTFITNVQSDMGTQGITLSVLARPSYLNLAPPADTVVFPGALTPVTSITARDTNWDTQRRRGG